MKKIVPLIAVLLFGLANIVCAQSSVTSNASPITTGVNSSVLYQVFEFPYTTRNLHVDNNDSTAYVYVNVDASKMTSTASDCFLLAPGNSLDLYDFLTDGITIVYDPLQYSTDKEASPISVIATY